MVISAVILAGLFCYTIIKQLLLLAFRNRIPATARRTSAFTKGIAEHRASFKIDRINFLSNPLQERWDKDSMSRAKIEASSMK